MKNLSGLIAFSMLALFASVGVSAQCTADTINCKDVDNPGEICPRNLPEVVVNEAYDEAITFIPPSQYEYNGNIINVLYITVDSVTNLPPGIAYYPNADTFYADTAYCVQVTGIPTVAGDFPLHIYVTPVVDVGTGPLLLDQVVDSSSVVMTVLEPSGVDPGRTVSFHILPTYPNPFSDVTQLGFYTPTDERIKLQVLNLPGKLVYEELRESPPGEHYFDFNGSGLAPGIYLYRITNRNRLYTGKLIKTR